MTREEINRRRVLAGCGVAISVSIAGCSTSDFFGPEFEEGDEQEVMLQAEWFGDGWSEETEDEEDEGGENESDSGGEDENESDISDLDYDPDEVPSVDALYSNEAEDSFAFVLISILENEDDAGSVVDEYGHSQMVNPGDPEIGDNSVRGEVSSMGVICYNLSNAVVLTGAADLVGLSLEADNARPLEAAEEIESRLNDL